MTGAAEVPPRAGAARRAGDLVVVGAVNVDLVVAAPRLPGPGETVVGGGLQRYGGGKGANAAVAAARAGAVVRLLGAVGADEDGAGALRELQADGVDVAGVAVLPDQSTGVALIVVSPDGENQIAVGAGANASVSEGHVHAALRPLLPQAGCVLVSTEISRDAVRAAVESAAGAGVPCVLNPAPVSQDLLVLLARGPLLTPNATECADLARLLGDAAGDVAQEQDSGSSAVPAASAAARRLCQVTGAPVVVTLGGEGALVVEPGRELVHVPPRRTTVRDTTGAGDTFNGVLALALAAGDSLTQAVEVASAAAALSVQHLGARAGMPTSEAIAEALHTP